MLDFILNFKVRLRVSEAQQLTFQSAWLPAGQEMSNAL